VRPASPAFQPVVSRRRRPWYPVGSARRRRRRPLWSITAKTFIPFEVTSARRRATASSTDSGLRLVITAGSIVQLIGIWFAGHRRSSVVQSSLLDVVVIHAEVVGHFVQHRVVHLVDQFLTRPGPPFDVNAGAARSASDTRSR